MRIGISLTNDAKDLFKKLSGNDFTDNISRHDEYLIKTVQKIGDRSVCYPMDMIDIEYIPEYYITHYTIDITDRFERVQVLKGG
jgi:hypothetical protein